MARNRGKCGTRVAYQVKPLVNGIMARNRGKCGMRVSVSSKTTCKRYNGA
ncbi:MAG: hypothetical protein RR033_04965 [Clostridia bacterium]